MLPENLCRSQVQVINVTLIFKHSNVVVVFV